MRLIAAASSWTRWTSCRAITRRQPLLARLGGFQATLPQRVTQFAEFVKESTSPQHVEAVDGEDEAGLWDALAGLNGERLAKVTLAPGQLLELDSALDGMSRRYILGGNIGFVAGDDAAGLGGILAERGARGLLLRGNAESPLLGKPLEDVFAARVKAVLDPLGKLV